MERAEVEGGVVAAGESACARGEEAEAAVEEVEVEEAVQEEEASAAAAAETATTMEEAAATEVEEATEEVEAAAGTREASGTCKSAGSGGGGSSGGGGGMQRWEGGVRAVEVLKSLSRTPKGVTVADVHGAAAEGVKFGACSIISKTPTAGSLMSNNATLNECNTTWEDED